MIHQIALTNIFGLPLVVIGGFVTLLSFAFTAYIGYVNHHGFAHAIPFKWHPRMVIISFCLAVIHMIFGLSVYMGF